MMLVANCSIRRLVGRKIGWLMTHSWNCIWCPSGWLSVREAVSRSIVSRWWLLIHLAKRTG